MLEKLKTFINEEKPYLNPSLTLRSLAEQIEMHPNQLSWLINEYIGQNYNEYINNQRTGTWQEFSDRGRLIAEGMYKLDEKVGTWKYYNTRGKLVDTEEY